ncbi:MAG: hypothetical protein KDA90_15040 [Planctomycetaceae bacterium]|nr:hypothetical protein [Planctomycetaceae bacterium]
MLGNPVGKLQLVQRRFDQFDFVVVGCGDVHGQWSPLGVDNVDDVAAFSALGVTDAVPLFRPCEPGVRRCFPPVDVAQFFQLL